MINDHVMAKRHKTTTNIKLVDRHHHSQKVKMKRQREAIHFKSQKTLISQTTNKSVTPPEKMRLQPMTNRNAAHLIDSICYNNFCD